MDFFSQNSMLIILILSWLILWLSSTLDIVVVQGKTTTVHSFKLMVEKRATFILFFKKLYLWCFILGSKLKMFWVTSFINTSYFFRDWNTNSGFLLELQSRNPKQQKLINYCCGILLIFFWLFPCETTLTNQQRIF